jgi:hypothetical protein
LYVFVSNDTIACCALYTRSHPDGASLVSSNHNDAPKSGGVASSIQWFTTYFFQCNLSVESPLPE